MLLIYLKDNLFCLRDRADLAAEMNSLVDVNNYAGIGRSQVILTYVRRLNNSLVKTEVDSQLTPQRKPSIILPKAYLG